ncbi:hypothetical protein PLESTB_000481600 [Pleodorina starrii]|uniref:Cysteine dioxygenase n=1 Tax=Pleodorina starrii TaxID=330485 RepID=A0A9W6BFS6_9CHLO|nr:hypothetical protein PLESTB_000481600 [Pleodorina starrii]
MEQLLGELRAAFQAEKDAGFTINNSQDPASFKRLNDRVQLLLKSYTTSNPGGGGDWRRFALFNSTHYVRNLVEANEDFELLVLCWKAGQVSRVHNHAASHCWLAVLDGQMREIQYQRAAPPPGEEAAAAAAAPGGRATDGGGAGDPPGSTVYVEATKSVDMKIGDVGYINDHLALHSVGCYTAPQQLPPSSTGGGGRGDDDGGAHTGGDGDSGWRLEGGVTLHLYSPPIRRVKIYEDNTVSERTPGYYSKGGVRV